MTWSSSRPLTGLFLESVISSLITLLNIHPLPFLRYAENDSNIFAVILSYMVFQIHRVVNRFLKRSERRHYRFLNLSGNGIHLLHLANKNQVNFVFRSSPDKGDHSPSNLTQKVLRRSGLVPRKYLVVQNYVAQKSPSFPHLVI